MICPSSYFQSRSDCPAGAHHSPASGFLAAAGGSTAHQSVQRSLWEGLVGWFGICGLISGLFVFCCFGGLVRGQVETNSKQVSKRILLSYPFKPPPPTAVLTKDRPHEPHSGPGPAAVCQLRSGRNLKVGETQRNRPEDSASRHGSPAEDTERGEDEDGGAGGKDFCPLFACQSGATMIVLGPAGCSGVLPAWTSSL